MTKVSRRAEKRNDRGKASFVSFAGRVPEKKHQRSLKRWNVLSKGNHAVQMRKKPNFSPNNERDKRSDSQEIHRPEIDPTRKEKFAALSLRPIARRRGCASLTRLSPVRLHIVSSRSAAASTRNRGNCRQISTEWISPSPNSLICPAWEHFNCRKSKQIDSTET